MKIEDTVIAAFYAKARAPSPSSDQRVPMPRLRVPSLQHLARNWRREPEQIKQLLVALAENGSTFTYDPLFGAVRDMLVFRHPYEEIAEGIRRGIRRPDVRENSAERAASHSGTLRRHIPQLRAVG